MGLGFWVGGWLDGCRLGRGMGGRWRPQGWINDFRKCGASLATFSCSLLILGSGVGRGGGKGIGDGRMLTHI